MWTGSLDAQERIVEIALAELAAWTGGSTAGLKAGPGTTRRLRWAAELRDGPLPAVDLYLTAGTDPSVLGPYEVIAPSDLAAQEAVSQCSKGLRLEGLPEASCRHSSPGQTSESPSLLAGALRIRRISMPQVEFVHSPDALIVLALDERSGWYSEVSRAQLLEPCIVLAHEDRAASVNPHLRTHARPGYRMLQAQSLEGLPPGWVAYLDVTIVRPADEETLVESLAASSETVNRGSQLANFSDDRWLVVRPVIGHASPAILGWVAASRVLSPLLISQLANSVGGTLSVQPTKGFDSVAAKRDGGFGGHNPIIRRRCLRFRRAARRERECGSSIASGTHGERCRLTGCTGTERRGRLHAHRTVPAAGDSRHHRVRATALFSPSAFGRRALQGAHRPGQRRYRHRRFAYLSSAVHQSRLSGSSRLHQRGSASR